MSKTIITQQWMRLCGALITGAIGTLAFSPFNYWPLALVSIIGLHTVLLSRTTKQACAIGFFWGFGLFISGTSWVYVSIAEFGGMPLPINLFLVILLALYLSLYPMLFAGILNFFWPKANSWRLVVAAPGVWAITEFLRSWVFTGFPWLEFGYTQIDSPLKGLAPILGVNSITTLLFILSGLILLSLLTRHIRYCTMAIICFASCWILGHIHWVKPAANKTAHIALVQGNIEQSLKWSPDTLDKTLKTYLQDTLPQLGKNALIIWPESAIPATEDSEQSFLQWLDNKLKENHTTLITGLIHRSFIDNTFEYFNSMIVLGTGTPAYHYPALHRYDKHHLVPFGEFVPFEKWLRPLAPLFNLPMSSFSRGSYIQPLLPANHYLLLPTICYEVILGKQVRANFHPQTDFLLTISNDAWFGHSIGPWQHFQMARMRALELGRPLLRATNNGITAVVEANGHVLAELPQFTNAVLNTVVTPTVGLTPYARFGSWPIAIINFFFISLGLLMRRK